MTSDVRIKYLCEQHEMLLLFSMVFDIRRSKQHCLFSILHKCECIVGLHCPTTTGLKRTTLIPPQSLLFDLNIFLSYLFIMIEPLKFTFSTVTGYFLQDEPSTDPDTFDYVSFHPPQ